MGDGKFKSIEPNEEILEIGKDENEETPEQLELERKKVEQEQNFEVGFRGQSVWLFWKFSYRNQGSGDRPFRLGPRFSNFSQSWSGPLQDFLNFLRPVPVPFEISKFSWSGPRFLKIFYR